MHVPEPPAALEEGATGHHGVCVLLTLLPPSQAAAGGWDGEQGAMQMGSHKDSGSESLAWILPRVAGSWG